MLMSGCRPLPRQVVLGCRTATLKCCAKRAKGSDVRQAWELLYEFNKKDAAGLGSQYTATPSSREELRNALFTVAQQSLPDIGWDAEEGSKELLIGVLASDIRLSVRALRDWAQALDVPFVNPESRVDGQPSIAQIKGGVFVKYIAQSQVCYVTQYSGSFRGVLVTFGQEQVGHFPLGLFDEAMAAPAPEL